MLLNRDPHRRRAAQMLTLATLFWGVSFPVMKAIGMAQQNALAHENSWFAAASMVCLRFGVAAFLMLMWNWRSLRHLTTLEIREGIGLGVFAGLGMLFQVDGLTYTSASSSAFLTQCCCLILPWVVGVRDRQWPSRLIVLCSFMAATGVAVLAKLDWRHFHLGRGELETLLSSSIFTAQILWLERPLFKPNRVSHFSMVMFGTMAAIVLPVALASMHRPQDWITAFNSFSVLALIAILVLFCTLIAFVTMNRWQPVVPAAEAGLIYAAEPVFASLFALFLPVGLSRFAGIGYPNELATASLLLGGGLITLANVLVQLRSGKAVPAANRSLEFEPG